MAQALLEEVRGQVHHLAGGVIMVTPDKGLGVGVLDGLGHPEAVPAEAIGEPALPVWNDVEGKTLSVVVVPRRKEEALLGLWRKRQGLIPFPPRLQELDHEPLVVGKGLEAHLVL